MAIIIIAIILFCGLVFSFILSTRWGSKLFGGHCGNFKFSYVLLKNFVVILLIALTEYFFITYYAASYISIDEHKVIYLMLSKINEYRDIDAPRLIPKNTF
jgi:hypothetical protein